MDVFLQAHAGDPVRVDRGSRPPVDLQEPALSMGLSIQTSVLNEMAGKAAFRGRGLIGRFLFAVPADIVGRRTLETVPVSASVRAGYDQAIMALLDLPEQRNMLNGELFAIQLTPEAHADWKAFAREVETGMAEGGPLESLRDWAGKAAGAAGRIAGVFHCIEHAGRLFHFCSNGCHGKFTKEPEAYLEATDPVCGMKVDRASARHFLQGGAC